MFASLGLYAHMLADRCVFGIYILVAVHRVVFFSHHHPIHEKIDELVCVCVCLAPEIAMIADWCTATH